jgi:hypothetical protein
MVRQTCLWRRASAAQQFIACVCAGACALVVALGSATADAGAAPPSPQKLWNEYPLDLSGSDARSRARTTAREKAIRRAAVTPADQESSKIGDSARVALFTALALSAMLALALLARKSRAVRAAAGVRALVAPRRSRPSRTSPKPQPASTAGQPVTDRSPSTTAPGHKGGSSRSGKASAPNVERPVQTPKVRAKAPAGRVPRAARREGPEQAPAGGPEAAASQAEQAPSKPRRKRGQSPQEAGTPAAQRPRKPRKKASAPDEQGPGQPTTEHAAQPEATSDQPRKRARARAGTASQGDEKPVARRPAEEKRASEGAKPARAKTKRKATSQKSKRNKSEPA